MQNNIVAYFQMDKNEEFVLETENDYFEMGKRAFRAADGYYNVFKKCFTMIFDENRNALCTNIAFACELYLKSLLFYNNIDCRKKHDLLELYSMLPIQIKKELKELHPCSNSSKDKFELEIKELGKAFIVFRYSYERKALAWNMQFLLELMLTLSVYAYNIFKDST